MLILDKISSKTAITGKLALGGGSQHLFTSKNMFGAAWVPEGVLV